MKIYKYANILIAALLLAIQLNAQYAYYNQNINSDSISCLQNLSIYREFQKQNLYSEAAEAWKTAYNSCRGSKKIIYQDGIKLIKRDIKTEEDEKKRKMLIDSMMHIYNERIKYFGQEAYVKGRQAVDLLDCDRNRADEAYELLKQSLDEMKEKSDPSVIAHYMLAGKLMYKKRKVSESKVVSDYLMCLYLLYNQIQKCKANKQEILARKKVIGVVDAIFERSKVGSYKNLIPEIDREFERNKENINYILRLQHLLRRAKCTDSNQNLYLRISMQIQKISPTSRNAKILANLYSKKDDDNTAIYYLHKAIKLTKNDSLKAKYYCDIASIKCFKLKKYEQARQDIFNSIKIKPNIAETYMLLGDLYALSSSHFSDNKFINSTIIWLAIDQYNKAKALDKRLKTAANQKIAYYKNYAPSIEEAFMHTYKKGDKYKIGGWINQETMVR